jgi:hypothetical protein
VCETTILFSQTKGKMVCCCSGSISSLISQKNPKKTSVKLTEITNTNAKSIIFTTLAGDQLMIIKVDDKKVVWCSILRMIAVEPWFQTSNRWKFIMGIKTLDINDVFEFVDNDMISITCIKIIPQIIFKLPSGEILVSIPFDCCRTINDGLVYIRGACFVAHQKMKVLGIDGYGTKKCKIHPLIDTYGEGQYEYPRFTDPPYDFYLNGEELDTRDILSDPGYDDITIIAEQKEIMCNNCEVLAERETIRRCAICDFLHCPRCGKYSCS